MKYFGRFSFKYQSLFTCETFLGYFHWTL